MNLYIKIVMPPRLLINFFSYCYLRIRLKQDCNAESEFVLRFDFLESIPEIALAAVIFGIASCGRTVGRIYRRMLTVAGFLISVIFRISIRISENAVTGHERICKSKTNTVKYRYVCFFQREQFYSDRNFKSHVDIISGYARIVSAVY